MPYRIKIGDQQFQSDIEGTGEWSRSVSRDFNDRIFRTRPGYEFKGHEGLYTFLYNHMTIGGVCEALEGRIYFNTGTSWDYEWKGDILPQDFQFDLLKRNVEGQVLDASWSAKINNAQDQKVFLRSTSTKNGVAIPPCDFTGCQFFDPSDATLGNYLPDRRICFRVYDIFLFLVNYYTDNTVTFTSDFFNIGGDGDQYYITTGQEIREATGWVNPEISFNELFSEMNKKLNLWIIVEGTQDQPIIRIEPQDYVFKNQLLLTITDPENLKMSTDLDQLYTIIKVGSSASEYNPSENSRYPTPRFYAWNDENYNTSGDCEFENNTLDLVSSWKIDTNTIEKVLNADDDYDDNIFIIEIDPTAPDYDAFKFTTDLTSSDTVQYIYNYNLTNSRVILNWFGAIPNEMIKDIGGNIYAYVNSPTTGVFSPVPGLHELDFTNDSIAPAIDFDDIYSGGEFESPYSINWNYTVSASIVNGGTQQSIQIYGYVYEDNTRTTQIAQIRPPGPFTNIKWWYTSGQSKTITTSGTVYLAAGNVIVWFVALPIYLSSGGGGSYTLNTAYAEMNTTEIDYNEASTNLIYVYDASKFSLSRTDFNTLDQGRGFVRILDTNANKKYDVWAKDVKYNSTTGVVEVGEFIGGSPPTELCWVLETGYWNDECYWLDEEILVESETDWFIMTVDTTQIGAGSTNNDQFKIQTTGGGYNYLVDWGDGTQQTGQTGDVTHTYAFAGTYTVKIAGTFPRMYYNFSGDRRKPTDIVQWGVLNWTSMENAFWGCGFLTATFTDAPNLSGVTSTEQMFTDCPVFDPVTMENWDVSTITDMEKMFSGCSAFNAPITTWDVSSVTTFKNMFNSCINFNQNIGNWSTTSVVNMNNMFSGATSFNQDISNWDLNGVTTIAGMFIFTAVFDQDIGTWDVSSITTASNWYAFGGGLSQANYDALLVGWTGWSGGMATKTVQNGVSFHAGTSNYSLGSDAADARAWLVGTKGWTITDGGGV